LGMHDALKGTIERVFFGGRSMRAGEYATYVFGNVVLILLVFFVLLNTIGYDWTGSLYPEGSGFRLDFLTGDLENGTPLVPEFVIFYVYLFYPLAFVTMLFGFVEYRKGYALGWSLVFINAIALAIYVVFPVSTYWWRQEFLANPVMGSFWASQAYGIWAEDTSFNCFPSLHAAVSTICFYAWHRYSAVKRSNAAKVVAIIAFIIAAGVIMSTLFIKQHYVADEAAGIILAWGVGKFFFDRLWVCQHGG
jgi:membrane-associated phospholipid phosphatase